LEGGIIKVKRLLIIAAMVTVLVTVVGTLAVANASENAELVYKAQLIDGPDVDGTAYGDVTVWSNGEMKVRLFVEGAPGEETYNLAMGYGWPASIHYVILFPFEITTDKHGRAIESFDLSDIPPLAGKIVAGPMFHVRTQPVPGPDPQPSRIVAVTGIVIP
jgi:hypothetical protein